MQLRNIFRPLFSSPFSGLVFWRNRMALVAGVLMLVLIMFPVAAQDATPDPGEEVAYTAEKVVVANFPVAMAFTPDGRLFYTEKATGNVRLLNAEGSSQLEPVIHLDTDVLVERGMLGIALDPNYTENGYIWVFHTRPGNVRDYPANEIVRFREENGVGSDPEVMLSVPIMTGELQHNGGNLHFDEDGLLYVSFGDYGDAANSQDMTVIPGKIHRFQVTDTGLEPAPDNPFADSSIYTYGLRNSFDFVLDPYSDNLFGSENGFHCDDEINRLLPGRNYGWSADYQTQCFGTDPLDLPDYMPPMVSYTPTIAPTGITVYDGELFPAWQGDIFFCAFNTGTMTRLVLDEARKQVVAAYPMDLGEFACRLDVEVAPDGTLYFTEPSGIYRIIPE
jgi:glucose/arabinose dehydrogenase